MLQHWLKMALPGADLKATAMTSKRAAEALFQVSQWLKGGERLELIQAAETAKAEAKKASASAARKADLRVADLQTRHQWKVADLELHHRIALNKAYREVKKLEEREKRMEERIRQLEAQVEAMRRFSSDGVELVD